MGGCLKIRTSDSARRDCERTDNNLVHMIQGESYLGETVSEWTKRQARPGLIIYPMAPVPAILMHHKL